MIAFSTRRWPFLSSGTPYPLLLSLFLLTATIQSSRPGLAQGRKPGTSTPAHASGRSKQERGDIARFGERVQAAIASNAKLFTTAMALATLGPAFHIRTTVESAGVPDSSGHLEGDLILVGRGDANLSNRVLPFVDHAEHNGPPEKALADLADQIVAS